MESKLKKSNVTFVCAECDKVYNHKKNNKIQCKCGSTKFWKMVIHKE